jgi:cell division protease FtsH
MPDHTALPAFPITASGNLPTKNEGRPVPPSQAKPDGLQSISVEPQWIDFAQEILAVLEGTTWAGSYPTPRPVTDEAPAHSTDTDALPTDGSDSYQSDTGHFANPWDAQSAQVEAQFEAAMTKILPKRPKAETLPWRPKAVTLLAALRLAKTFNSAREMADLLAMPPALTLIATGQSAHVQTVLKTLATLSTSLPALSANRKCPDVLLADTAMREPPLDLHSTFGALSDHAAGTIERGTVVVFVASVASTAPKALRDLRPNVIPLVPLDREMLCILLHLAYPDRDLASAIADLPDHLPFARLSASTLTLALRSAEPDVAIRAIGSALSPAPRHSRSLADFPLPQTVRCAVDQLIADLRDWQADAVPWRDIPRGLLLSGPPGCGKTELARLIGEEAGIAVVHGSLTKWSAQSTRSGDALKAMRAAFTSAAEQAPSVLFIDEIDAFGNRARPQDHNSAYTDYIVTALLDLLDGFQSLEGVMIIGATNHAARLDAAITRAGRFDLSLALAQPDIDQLPQALRWHLADDLAQADLTAVAQAGIGMAGADIAAAVRSARARARAARRDLVLEDLGAAIAETCPPLPAALRKRIAIHESGHAIVGAATGQAWPERLVLSSAGGYMQSRRDDAATDRAVIEAELAITLAGRAAETLFFLSPASGAGGDAQSDLARATALATALETSFGLGETLVWQGPVETCMSQISRDMDLRRRVEMHLRRAEARALRILRANMGTLEALSATLAASSVVQGPMLDAHLTRVRPESAPDAHPPQSATPAPRAQSTRPKAPTTD